MKNIKLVKVKPGIGPTSIFHINKDSEYGSYNDNKPRKKEDMTRIFEKTVLHNAGLSTKSPCQLISFQRATKWLILLGQMVGLMPLLGVLTKPPANMRFKTLSIRFLYSVTMFLAQSVISLICLVRMFRLTLSVKSIGFASFYISSALTTLLFIQVATKWPYFLKKIPLYKLDEYIDSRMEAKCNAAIIIFVILAIVEHIFSEVATFATVMGSSENSNLYEKFIEQAFPWIVELSIPNNLFIGIVTQFVNITATLTWNYSDLFIVCISIYLISILEGINKTVACYETKCLCTSFWSAIREDYSRAAQLVRACDEVISGVVFTSFASNLFFICLQLYNLLSDGLGHKMYHNKQHRFSSGPFYGYEHVIYFTYSMVFVLFRYLSVSLIAARVHTTSLAMAPALYSVPSAAYNVEVAGTIFTYELVLLQYGG